MNQSNLAPVLRHETLVETVIHQLSEYILEGLLEGRLHANDKLPSEKKLSETLNVGRSTLREATKVLVHLGLIEVKSGQGTFITNGTNFNTAPFSWGLILNEQSIEELIEARITIEADCVAFTTQRASDEELRKIEETILDFEENKMDHEKLVESDVLFHIRIAEAAQNSVLLQTLKTVRTLLEIWISKVIDEPENYEGAIIEHRKVFEAIKRRDPVQAQQEIKNHLSQASNRLRKYLIN